MNAQEFKTWFEGFAAAIDVVPSSIQWDTIKEKCALVEDIPSASAVSQWVKPLSTVQYTLKWMRPANQLTSSSQPH